MSEKPLTSEKIRLPEILNIPPKLLPVLFQFNNYRYFLIEGGRGSAKTQSVARIITYISEKRKVRVVCGREIQRTIGESVYTVFNDLIQNFKLRFYIGANKIEHILSKSTINFRGFREDGRINIKGLEGTDILWIDEGQQITKPTIDIIIPTIRKNNAKIIFTMNRFLEDDPVFVELAGRKDCLHIHIDYHENQHCPEALIKEAEECRKKNKDDYKHIWLGQPLEQATNAAFRNVMSIVDENIPTINLPIIEQYNPHFDYVVGVDYAKSVDYFVVSVFCIQTKSLVYWERCENENRTSWNLQKEKTKAVSQMYGGAVVVPDSTGVGDPITEDLQRAGVNVFIEQNEQKENPKEIAGFKFTSVSKDNLIEKLKVAIELQCFRIPNIPILADELLRFQAVKTPSGRIKYSAPEATDELGKPLYHDDCVISLALALWGSRDMIYNPDYKPPSPPTKEEQFWKTVKRDILTKNNLQNDESVVYDEEDDMIDILDTEIL